MHKSVRKNATQNSSNKWHTLALVMNSCIIGLALCSSVSSTNVNGLALSLRLSNFWNNKRLCERLCACAEGAILSRF